MALVQAVALEEVWSSVWRSATALDTVWPRGYSPSVSSVPGYRRRPRLSLWCGLSIGEAELDVAEERHGEKPVVLARAAVIWGIVGLIVSLVIDFLTPQAVHLWLYGGFGLLAGGGSWALKDVRRVPQGLVVGVIVGLITGLLDGTLAAAAASPAVLHPGAFIVLKYVVTMGLFAFLAGLPWSLRTL